MEANYNEMPEEAESGTRRAGKYCCKILGLIILVVAVLAVLLQAILYNWATMTCSQSHLTDYVYPGGGEENLVPSYSLLIEQEPRFFSSSFIVQPSDEVGLATGASTGVYFKTWGPLWNTYVYQDDLGMQTFVVRDRPIAMGGSHKIMRCDGTGPVYVVTEGSHVIMNKIRSIFGMYTSRVYNIWQDNKLIGLSEKIGGSGQSHKQVIFRDPKKASPFASAFLKDRHYHGMFDEWFVSDEAGETNLPAFIPNAVAMLMAFPTAEAKRSKQAAQKETPAFNMFAALPPSDEEATNLAEPADVDTVPPESLAAEATDIEKPADVDAAPAESLAAEEGAPVALEAVTPTIVEPIVEHI